MDTTQQRAAIPAFHLLRDARVVARTAGLIGVTWSAVACLDAELMTSDEASRQTVTYKWVGRWGKALLQVFGLEVTARGLPTADGRYPAVDAQGRGRVFVMNHRSMLDIFVNLAFVEANMVSRADLSRWPVIGRAARKVGTLFVDRANKQSGAAVIHAMCDAIERGQGVLVYPEGTTFIGDEVRPFRAGAFITAQRTGAEIVPIGIAYGGQGTSYFQEPFPIHYRRVTSSPATKIGLVFGEPIAAGADVETLRSVAHERVQELVREARAALCEG
ncbi:lysophospholipid acyltransferase family protein [Sorangium sp. So ce834]|uniref:lysophospholipid acyltransferase family protein n=1 Tax=Sorangium sp. So ce834 TaxID=3133321 RepID=UPI003F5F6721